ncbi:MAG: SRPBCC family protein [Prevotella sp.]
MTTFESSVREIDAPQTTVYATLSDLQNLERIKDRLPQDKVKDLTFDSDSVSASVSPVGSVSLRIVNREPHKCIKFETTNSPIPFNFWIQLLPVTERTCKMKLTIKAELNPFIKGMVQKPLQEGIEKMADALQMFTYK